MPSLRAFLAASVLILAAAEAGAQADLSRATCAGLNELRRAERAEMLLWLHGYYAGAAQRSVVDRGRVAEALAAVKTACEREPGMALIGSEARALFLGERRDPPAGPAAPSPAPANDAPRPAAPASARPTPVR